MNILVLTGRYLPKMSPNGVCINNIIQCIDKNDNNVSCICYDDGLVSHDEGIHIYKVSRGLIKSMEYRLEGKQSLVSKLILKTCNVLDRLQILLSIPRWPWIDPIFTSRLYRKADSVVKKENIDAIIAVHMPISSIIVGAKLKERYPHIRYYPYFLDSLSGGCPLSLYSLKWNTMKKLKWEERLLPCADKIVVMNSSRKHHERFSQGMSYFERFVFLDIPLLKIENMKSQPNPFDDKLVNILFCGTANSPLRNMSYFSKLASELEDIQFTIIGECNCKNMFSSNNVKFIAPLPHEELVPYLQHADVFINFGVATPSAISGKIFEYMSYAKPIISTYSIDDEACIPYLDKYQASLMIDERNDDIKEEAKRVLEFIRIWQNQEIDLEKTKISFKDNMPETFLECILFNEEVINE